MELFREPGVLILGAAAALLSVPYMAWIRSRKQRLLALLGDPATVARLIPAETRLRQRWSLLLAVASFLLMIVALAGPQWGVELVEGKSGVRQIVIAIDTSKSMAAEDLQPSRIERAKAEMAFLTDRLTDARVGVVAFAGRAHIQCPLTTDRGAVKMFLRQLSVDMLPEPGSHVAKALALGTKLLAPYPGEKAIVLITDGEDNGGGAAEAAAAAKEAGVRIYGLVAATPQGAPIPVRDASGTLTGYKTNKKGVTVVSKPDERTMTELAEATGGARVWLETGASAEILSSLEELSRTESSAGGRARFKNRFQWPLAAAWLLLLAAWLLPEARSGRGPMGAGRQAKPRRAEAEAAA